MCLDSAGVLSYKLDFSSCDITSGFGKSSHIYTIKTHGSELRGQEEAGRT